MSNPFALYNGIFLRGDEGAGFHFRYMEVLSCKSIDKKFKEDD